MTSVYWWKKPEYPKKTTDLWLLASIFLFVYLFQNFKILGIVFCSLLATLPWLKCSTAIKAPFLYLNLCLSVMLNSLSYSFTSICVLTAIDMPWWLLTMLHWLIDWLIFWCFNATFSNISAISWRPVLVAEEAGVHGENHRQWASSWQTLSLAAASRVHLFVIYKAGSEPTPYWW